MDVNRFPVVDCLEIRHCPAIITSASSTRSYQNNCMKVYRSCRSAADVTGLLDARLAGLGDAMLGAGEAAQRDAD